MTYHRCNSITLSTVWFGTWWKTILMLHYAELELIQVSQCWQIQIGTPISACSENWAAQKQISYKYPLDNMLALTIIKWKIAEKLIPQLNIIRFEMVTYPISVFTAVTQRRHISHFPSFHVWPPRLAFHFRYLIEFPFWIRDFWRWVGVVLGFCRKSFLYLQIRKVIIDCLSSCDGIDALKKKIGIVH